MDCPKCNSTITIRDGFVQGRQRYRCKNCDYRFSVEFRGVKSDINLKRHAIILYLAGLGITKIEELINVDHSTIFYWTNEFTKKFNLMRSESKPVLKKMTSKKDTAVKFEDKNWVLIYHDGVPEIRFK